MPARALAVIRAFAANGSGFRTSVPLMFFSHRLLTSSPTRGVAAIPIGLSPRAAMTVGIADHADAKMGRGHERSAPIPGRNHGRISRGLGKIGWRQYRGCVKSATVSERAAAARAIMAGMGIRQSLAISTGSSLPRSGPFGGSHRWPVNAGIEFKSVPTSGRASAGPVDTAAFRGVCADALTSHHPVTKNV